MLELFLKIQENIRVSILKRRLQNLYKRENFKAEIKPMIENLQDELKINKQKLLNFVLPLDRSWCVENTPKISLMYLIDRICKIKHYLNYIIWWYKSKYSSSPKDIVKSVKKKKKFQKLQLLNFLAKCLTVRKCLVKTLTFARRKHL